MSNKKTGTLVITSRQVVTHEGNVVSVTDGGVTILAREFGRQTKVEQSYSWSSIVAHSDEGEGFLTVFEEVPMLVYHGIITNDNDGVTVETESGRIISAANNPNVTYRVIYDGADGPTTVYGKTGRRNSTRFDTKSDKTAEKAAPAKKASTKTAKVGKRRA